MQEEKGDPTRRGSLSLHKLCAPARKEWKESYKEIWKWQYKMFLKTWLLVMSKNKVSRVHKISFRFSLRTLLRLSMTPLSIAFIAK